MALRGWFSGLTRWDRLILLFLLLITGFSFWMAGDRRKGTEVTIEGEAGILYRAPLGEDQRLSVDGQLGPVVIGMDATGVAVLEAPCPNKFCIRQGRIERSSEVIVCVPSRLIARLSSPEPSRYDAISR